jgi:ABC-2 type transport system ATP-binding protein
MAIIDIKHLTKKFNHHIVAVDDISFQVKKWEIFAFLGPNWAGKSTTIKMLTTLLHPTSGDIAVNGYDLSQKDEIRKSFGIVFQDQSLDEELTAYENMWLHAMLYKVTKNLRKTMIEELLKFVELRDRKDDLVKKFSWWMKRRLEIARGLLHHPKIFFLDEPTIWLDPQTRNHIWDYIKNLNQKEGITVFFTTHYMDEAEKIADRIAIIDHGKIVAQWTMDELRTLTGKHSLDEIFLALTGNVIREEAADASGRMKMMRKHR